MLQSKKLFPLHLLCLTLLFFLFGGNLLSLSVDVTHHYSVVDALMKQGTNRLPYLGVMSLYPSGAYWATALLGYLIGSGFVAMWLISIVAIYAAYYFLFSLLMVERDILAAIIFIIVASLLRESHALVGFEVVGNFFYPQLLVAAAYFWLLYYLSTRPNVATFFAAAVVVLTATVAMTVHALPAIEMLATFGTVMLVYIASDYMERRKPNVAAVAVFVVYCMAGAALLKYHPAFASLRTLSQNEGSIEFAISGQTILILGLCASASSAFCIWRSAATRPYPLDIVIFSAVFSAVALMLLQSAWFRVFHEGSLYAVKKHSFFVFTLSVFALARAASGLVGSLDRFKLPLALYRLTPLMLAVAAAFCVLQRPGLNIYKFVHDIDYAETALVTSHPNFKPGNTAVIAESVHFVIRYMITVTTFQMKVSELPAVGLLDNSFDPKSAVEYVVVDRISEANRACGIRYAETSQFSIIPTSCLPDQTKQR